MRLSFHLFPSHHNNPLTFYHPCILFHLKSNPTTRILTVPSPTPSLFIFFYSSQPSSHILPFKHTVPPELYPRSFFLSATSFQCDCSFLSHKVFPLQPIPSNRRPFCLSLAFISYLPGTYVLLLCPFAVPISLPCFFTAIYPSTRRFSGIRLPASIVSPVLSSTRALIKNRYPAGGSSA